MNGRFFIAYIALPLLHIVIFTSIFTNAYADDESRRIFSKESFWYQPIPKNVELHPNSAAFALDFVRQMNKFYGNVSINLYKYASPVYIVDNKTATTRVKQWNCQNKPRLDESLAEQWSSVPIPVYALPADGTDAEMSIYQPETDTLWEFWKMKRIDGEWQACWGGRLSSASKSDGIHHKYYGTTATSLPFIGGQITAAELKKGEINHVMGIALVESETHKIYSWPAHRSDGYNPKNIPNRIPEGLRFRLDPNIDIDNLNLHPVARTVAKAAQKYGFVVWDHAGAITLRAENPITYTSKGEADPYTELWAGTPNRLLLKGIPWDKLEFMPMDYGKPQ